MRKRKTKVAAGCMAAILALSVFFPFADVSAGRKTKTYSDDFDNESTLDSYDAEIWSELGTGGTVKTTQLKEPGKVLTFKGSSANGENTVMMSLDWYWEIHSLTFDIKVPTKGSWFGLDFVDIDEPEDYVGDFKDKGEPMCYGSLKMSDESVFSLSGTDWTEWGFADKNIAGQWVSVKIVTDDAKTGKIYLAPRGKAFDKSKARKLTLGENQSFYNSNIVFCDYAFSGYMLDNIEIKTDTGVVKEDFNDDKNQYFEMITLKEDKSSVSLQIVEEGAVRKLSFANAAVGDRLVSNNVILAEDKYLNDTEEVLHATFSPDFTDADKNSEIAYVFGLSDVIAEPFLGTWAYVVSGTSGKLVQFTTDGVEKVKANGSFGKTLKGDKIELSLTKAGVFKVYLNGTQILSCTGVKDYAGNFAFVAKSKIEKAVYLDDVTVSNHIYDVLTTKSFQDDFSTNRLGTGTESDYAYYAESGSINVSNGELAYEGCLDGTYFGPAYEYETYEMTFKLTSILTTEDDNEKQHATALDRWIGIDFGKQNPSTKKYGTYGMLLIRVTHPEDQKMSEWKTSTSSLWRLEGSSELEDETYTQVKDIPASYFKDISYDGKTKMREDISSDAAVCFKVVAKENRVELYMKRADEKKYTLYITVDGVNPAGWTGITCTGWSYWTIDDFAIKNTAKIYNEAPEIVIEETEKVSYEERGLNVKDTGWAEEQKLNANRDSGTNPMVLIGGVAGVVVLLGLGIGIGVVRKKKKGGEKTQ